MNPGHSYLRDVGIDPRGPVVASTWRPSDRGISAGSGAATGASGTPPASPDGHTEPRPAAEVASAASPTRSDAERRARTTMVAMVATAQNGTSGVFAESDHVGSRLRLRREPAAVGEPAIGGHFATLRSRVRSAR
jgi:hypothetical protein